jgi:hypothetical protein
LFRRWTCTDEAGNTGSKYQTVIVTDDEPPILHGVPGDIVVESDQVPPLDEALDTVSATDNSGADIDVTVKEEYVSGKKEGCKNEYVLVRTFCAKDECGNRVCEEQTITVVDTTPPIIDRWQDETVECDSVPAPCVVETAGENLDVYFSETVYSSFIVRTWASIDCSGNTAEHSQTIWVVDTEPPVLSRYPGDMTVECDCDTFPQAPTIIALDNCDAETSVSFEETRTDGTCEDSYTITRTWTATDSNGNSVTHTQIVEVYDESDPEFPFQPADSEAECDAVADAPANEARDNCDDTMETELVETITSGRGCDADYTITRTWSATDRCGNSASYSQDVSVSDTTAPMLAEHCKHSTCVVGNDLWHTFSDASSSLFDSLDNCGSVDVDIFACNTTSTAVSRGTDNGCSIGDDSVSVWGTAGTYGTTYTVYATLTDDCGNSNIVSTEINVPIDSETTTDCIEGTESL